MEGPSVEFRQDVASRMDGVSPLEIAVPNVTLAMESELENLLQEIDGRLRDDIGSSEILRDGEFDVANATEILAAIDAWMSLASYAIGRTYAPQSPFRGGVAGWTLDVGRRIEDLARSVRGALSSAAMGLGAESWSVSSGFPFGISVGLSFPAAD
jgi:hypothetical protein